MQFVSTLFIAVTLISSGLGHRFSVSKVDDIKVSNSNGIIQCDKIECPKDTVRCHVSKQNSDEYPAKISREILCIGVNGKILQQKSWSEVFPGNRKLNIQVDMYDDGRTSVFSQGSSVGFNPKILEGMTSIMRQIGSYFSGFQDFFLNPFRGLV